MDLDRWNEDDYDAMSEGDCCEHGVGFDEDCEDCEDDPIGCVFPGKCLMPGEHLESECHTAEMMEAALTREQPESEADRLRALCASVYQFVGANMQRLQGVEPFLDALSNAANCRPFDYDHLLPYASEESISQSQIHECPKCVTGECTSTLHGEQPTAKGAQEP